MSAAKKYVIDTNILVDYPDIVPSDGMVAIKEPTIDLSEAQIIIPTAVIRELSSFKKEKTERGKAARVVLKRLRALFELKDFDVPIMEPMLTGAYHMKSSVAVGRQVFSILPVHKDFKKTLPFAPAEDDMDGQIILATIAVEFIYQMIPVDGTAEPEDFARLIPTGSIVLLTNDNGLAIRASRRGVITSRYGYKPPAPYTGRRDVVVTRDLLDYFYSGGKIELDIWGVMVPRFEEEPQFVANEFVVMHLRNPEDYPDDPCMTFRNIGRYDAEEQAIVSLKYALDFPGKIMNAGQAIYAEALMNPKFAAVICKGPAGSGKTYMATIYGYKACIAGDYIGVTVVPCENLSNLGALPGGLNEKMDLDMQPLKNALRNYLLKDDKETKKKLCALRSDGTCNPLTLLRQSSEEETPKKSLKQELETYVETIWEYWFSNIPIEYARGRDFAHELAIYDEFQDQNAKQADTLIKRIGMDGKIVITGDTEQVHAPYLDSTNNGLVYASQLLLDNPMVAQVCFTEDEVIRHPLVKMVAERQKEKRTVE